MAKGPPYGMGIRREDAKLIIIRLTTRGLAKGRCTRGLMTQPSHKAAVGIRPIWTAFTSLLWQIPSQKTNLLAKCEYLKYYIHRFVFATLLFKLDLDQLRF